MKKILIITAIIAGGLTAQAQTLILSDSFDTGGVATNDLSYNLVARQAGTAATATYSNINNTNELTATGELYTIPAFVAEDLQTNLASHLADNGFSLKTDAKLLTSGDPESWTSFSLLGDVDNARHLSPMTFLIRQNAKTNDLIWVQHGVGSKTPNMDAVAIAKSQLDAVLGGSFDVEALHTYEIRAQASTATNGTFTFYVDGVAIPVASDLPYQFNDSTGRKLRWINTGTEAKWDNLNISTIPYLLLDTFDTGGVATNDLNYNLAARQLGSLATVGFTHTTNASSLTAAGRIQMASYDWAGGLDWINLDANLIGDLADNSFSFSMDGEMITAGDGWMSMSMTSATDGQANGGIMSFIAFPGGNLQVFYGGAGANPPSAFDIAPATLAAEIPGFSLFDEHNYEFKVLALSATNGVYNFKIDGITFAKGLPYEFGDNTLRKLGWITPGSCVSEWDDLALSILPDGAIPPYVFFDDFNSGSSDVNVNTLNRQANGLVGSTYYGNPELYSITNNEVLGINGALWQITDMSSLLPDENFELSCEVAMLDPSASWATIYLYDVVDPYVEDGRADSRLGCLIWGDGQPDVVFSLYAGAGGGQISGGDVIEAELDSKIGGTYDRSQPHTIAFVSSEGEGGSNTYAFVVDDVVIRSGIEYGFDGDMRRIGIHSAGLTDGALFDDVALRARTVGQSILSDTFDTPDTDYINTDVVARQADGMLVSSFSGNPELYSITNGKLHQKVFGAWAKIDADLAPQVVGEDFEFSFKLAMLETNAAVWTSVYIQDENDDDRSGSNLGLHIPGTGDTNTACILYHGFDPGQGVEGDSLPVSLTTVEDALGLASGTFNKADEHEYKFISYAEASGTNTYIFLIDGSNVVSGLEYYIDGTERRLQMVGTMDGSGAGALIDDIDVRLNFEKPSYENWAIAMGLTPYVNDGRMDDAENGGIGDGMVNLLEYAFGGDPLVDDAATYQPASDFPDVDNWVYVYRRRTDAAIRGLVYELFFKLDLITDPDWLSTVAAGIPESIGPIDSDFEAVTNSIPITALGLDQAFLKLDITETP